METINKYRKEEEGYTPYKVNYRKHFKYHLSHEKFIVPWQMEVVKKENEKEKV